MPHAKVCRSFGSHGRVRKERAPIEAPFETLRTLDAIIHLPTTGSKGNRSRTCRNLHSKGNRYSRNSNWFLRTSFLPSSLITSTPLNPEATRFLTHRMARLNFAKSFPKGFSCPMEQGVNGASRTTDQAGDLRDGIALQPEFHHLPLPFR